MSEPYPDIEKTVQEYVLGKLSDSEAEDFEAFFLGRPEIVEMVGEAQMITLGLSASDVQLDSVDDNQVYVHSGWLQTLQSLFSVSIPVYAVMGLLIVTSAGPMLLNSHEKDQIGTVELVRFSTGATRGNKDEVVVNFSKSDVNLAMLIKIDDASYHSYRLRAELVKDSSVRWQSKKFQLSALRDALVNIPPRSVFGEYKITAFGIREDGVEIQVSLCNYHEVCAYKGKN
jgi:hypothetical protein